MGSSLIVGLTGGIGSGKSTVANMFAEAGVSVVDTDAIAHELTQPSGVAMPAIRTAFGQAYVDSSGALDRAAMRTLVFADPKAKCRLEEILHPLIGAAADEHLSKTTGPYSVLVVPLLFESRRYRNRVDRILVVDCEERVQITRAMARTGLTESAVRAIMASQVSRAVRLAGADDVIDNNGDPSELPSQVHSLHQHYSRLSAEKITIGIK